MTENIIIEANIPRVQYISDGTSTIFQTPFQIFKKDYVKIFFDNIEVQEDTYSVALDKETKAQISFNAPPPSQTTITIARNLPVARTSRFQEGGALRAEVLNYEFDYQIACLQQVSDGLNRSMLFPIYAIDSDINLTLPTPEKGKSIVWAEDGKSLENSTLEINKITKEINEKTQSAIEASLSAKGDAQSAQENALISTQQAQIALQEAQKVAEALEIKANIEADNFSAEGKEVINTWGLPNWTAGVNQGVNTDYTAKSNGWIYVFAGAANDRTNGLLTINGAITIQYKYNWGSAPTDGGQFVPISKGDVYRCSNLANGSMVFFPCKL